MPIKQMLGNQLQEITNEALRPILSKERFEVVIKIAEGLHALAIKTNRPEIQKCLDAIFKILELGLDFAVPVVQAEDTPANQNIARQKLQVLKRRAQQLGIAEDNPNAMQLVLQADFFQKLHDKTFYAEKLKQFTNRTASSTPLTEETKSLRETYEKISTTENNLNTLTNRINAVDEMKKILRNPKNKDDFILKLHEFLEGAKNLHDNPAQAEFLELLLTQAISKNPPLDRKALWKKLDERSKKALEEHRTLSKKMKALEQKAYHEDVHSRFNTIVRDFNKVFEQTAANDTVLDGLDTNGIAFLAAAKHSIYILNRVERGKKVAMLLQGVVRPDEISTPQKLNLITRLFRHLISNPIKVHKKRLDMLIKAIKHTPNHLFKQVKKTKKPRVETHEQSNFQRLWNAIQKPEDLKTIEQVGSLMKLVRKEINDNKSTIFDNTLKNLKNLTKEPPGLVKDKTWFKEIENMEAILQTVDPDEKKQRMKDKLKELGTRTPEQNNEQLIALTTTIGYISEIINKMDMILKIAELAYNEFAPDNISAQKSPDNTYMAKMTNMLKDLGSNMAINLTTEFSQKILLEQMDLMDGFTQSLEQLVKAKSQTPIEPEKTQPSSVSAADEITLEMQNLESQLTALEYNINPADPLIKELEIGLKEEEARLSAELSQKQRELEGIEENKPKQGWIAWAIEGGKAMIGSDAKTLKADEIKEIKQKQLELQRIIESISDFGKPPTLAPDSIEETFKIIKEANQKWSDIRNAIWRMTGSPEIKESLSKKAHFLYQNFANQALRALLEKMATPLRSLAAEPSDKKLHKLCELFKALPDIESKLADYSLNKDIIAQMQKSTKLQIIQALQKTLEDLSWDNIHKKNKKQHTEHLQQAHTILENYYIQFPLPNDPQEPRILDTEILQLYEKFRVELDKHERLKTSQNKFGDSISSLLNHLHMHITAVDSKEPNAKQHKNLTKDYEEKYKSTFALLGQIQLKQRKADLEFLQTIFDLIDADSEMLDINKAAILLGALNYVEHALKTSMFTFGVNNFKKMIGDLRDEVFREVEIDTPDLFKSIEKNSKQIFEEYVKRNEDKFKDFSLANKLLPPQGPAIVHQQKLSNARTRLDNEQEPTNGLENASLIHKSTSTKPTKQ